MRAIDRRTFLAASGAVAASGLLAGCGGGGIAPLGVAGDAGPASAPPVPSEPPSIVADLSFEHFESLVGESFLVENRQGEGGLLVLSDVRGQDELGEFPPDVEFRDPFTLVLHGEQDALPGEGRYDVTHPEFGVFELHVIPRMPQDDLGRYDIVFS